MHLIGSSLSCKREGKLIFSELSFKVSSGEICLIKGPNGSGKSTLLRLLAGFIKVSSGEITLDNKKITNKNDVIYENFLTPTPLCRFGSPLQVWGVHASTSTLPSKLMGG